MSRDGFVDSIRKRLSPATAFSLRYYRARLKSARFRLSGGKTAQHQRRVAANDRPQIAVFDDLIPRPDRDAGSARMAFILGALASWAHPVLLTIGKTNWPEYESLLWAAGIETASAFEYKRLLNERDFSAVILSRPWVASALLRRIRNQTPKLKIVYDMVDLHHIRAEREAQLTGDPRFAREFRTLRRIEIDTARAVDFLWCGSPVDQKMIRREVPDVPSIVVPTIHTLHQRGLPFTQRQHLLFVGNFSHRPNVDSVEFMAREVMPLLRKEIPQLELMVVGANAPDHFSQFESVGVRVAGHVPSLDPVMGSSRVFVAPIRFGSGVNGKIGEALSYGLPVVTTTIGAEGWDFQANKQVLMADTPASFAQEVLMLYHDEVLWQKLSDEGYLHVSRNNTPEVVGRIINQSIFSLSKD